MTCKSLQGATQGGIVSGQLKKKTKLESKFQKNNMRDVWSWMKKITGFKKDQTDGSLDRASELNMNFNRSSSDQLIPFLQ